jgi:AmmeMemoRadiSam system protein B
VNGVRPPAVAGAFYPADPDRLRAGVDAALDAIKVPAEEALGSAYVVPHAGHRYSGPTAAHVYARLRVHAARIERVLLIGPAHRVPLRGCAAPTHRAWRTPLGEVPVQAAPGVAMDDAPHAPEHSLEVQLPFLQRVLPPDVPVLPVVVGLARPDEVSAVIAATAGPGTVILCSTDLSHYEPDAAARAHDARTAAAVLDLAPQRLGRTDACGYHALCGLLSWAGGSGLSARELHRCTSADTAGDPSRVVGYAAFALG